MNERRETTAVTVSWATVPEPITLTVDDQLVDLVDDGCSLLEALRDQLGLRSVKDGCSPQGQCGCCTVLVDGQPRVSCVTPLARVAGRSITTVDGLPEAEAWADALCATGGSQCGFCTPGIIVRLASRPSNPAQALLAHLCRCTGWQTIIEAVDSMALPPASTTRAGASERAELEGHTPQRVGRDIALGRGGFADDSAPPDALVAMLDTGGEWVVAESLTAVRALAGRVQGRRTTAPLQWPIELPDGDWIRTLQTTWVEPGYLEPDASWCAPGGEPSSPLANGGAFGGKSATAVMAAARRLADRHGRPVRALYTREDVVRLAPKRPPLAAAQRADGSGVVVVARTTGIAEVLRVAAPGLEIIEVDVSGPPTSSAIRAAGWAEMAALQTPGQSVSPAGASASASIDERGEVHVTVICGEVLDETILRSYCIGAAHQALGWVRSEGLSVDAATGEIHDLTIRSFGILRAVDMPRVHVTIRPADGPPVNGSDAVFAAVAGAAWRAGSFQPRWPFRSGTSAAH